MASDRARVTYDPTRKWRGLIAQQGRVTLEADFNEAATIDEERDRQLTLDFVGPVGTPSIPAPGYAVTAVPAAPTPAPAPGSVPGPAPGDLTIASGTLYVGGERLVLDAPVTYSTQPEWLDYSSYGQLWVPPAVPPSGTIELVYLLASEQEVSAVEDPALADVALGGPDTMQRLRVIQRFLRQTLPAAPSNQPGSWWSELATYAPGGAFTGVTLDQSSMLLESTTTLQVSFSSASAPVLSPGQPGSTSGYLGAENQLIRVLVTGIDANAPTVVWGFDDASFLYRVRATYDSSTDTTTLTLANSPVDANHYPAAGQAVELLRDVVWLTATDYIASPTGFVTTVSTAYEPTTMTLGIAGAPPADYLPPAAPSTSRGPNVTTISPVVGVVAGGTPVTVTGTGFTGATAAYFGANAGSGLLVQSDTALTVISPAASQAEAVDVTVVTPLGTSPATGTEQFSYAQPGMPEVTAVAPASGGLSGGTLVTVSGSGFTDATAVSFGTNWGIGLVIESDAQLTMFSPAAGVAGPVEVTVVTSQGTSPGGAEFTYTPSPPPQVTGISPVSGGPSGGTPVTVIGSGFTGATAVDFGAGNPGTGLSVVSDTQLTVISPSQPQPPASPTVDVIVTTPEGSSPPAAGDRFTYLLQVSGVSPAAAPPSGGTTVTVAGSGFTNATAVYFGANAATAMSIASDTQLTVTSPAGAGTVDVSVTTAAGRSPLVANDKFAYEPTPQLYLRVWQGLAARAQEQPVSTGPQGSATVAFSLEGTGATVTLTASNGRFNPGDYWRFALRPIEPATVYPARYLAAGQPPDGPRTWICPLALLTWQAGSATPQSLVPQFWNLVTLTNAMTGHTVAGPPKVTAINPTSGPPSGGTLVAVTGSGFVGASTVNFGSVPGTGLSVLTDTQLSVVSPPGGGVVGVTVVSAAGTSSSTPFLYVGVTGVSPAVGAPTGGTNVTVTGTGFTEATAVHFGGTLGTGMSVTSDTKITVVSPPGGGVVDVTVVTPFGTSATQAGDQFAYVAVRGINPTFAPQGGTLITLSGSGFQTAGVTEVSFGGTLVAANVESDTTITASSPAGFNAVSVNVVSPRFGTTQGGPSLGRPGHS